MKEVKIGFDIYQYIGMILRRKWFFIFPLVAISVSFMVATFFFPKAYVARAIILIEEKAVVNPLLGNLAVTRTVKEKMNALREEILAWPRLFQLVERLELNKDIKSPLELERLIAGIRKNIGLNMRSSEVVIVSYRGKNPKETQVLVNTLCDILIKRNTSSTLEDTGSAIDFIDEQLVIYKQKLDESESSLREFKEVYGLQMIPQELSSNQAGVASNDINSPKAPLYRINDELARLEAELVMAGIDCTDQHPRVKSLKERIEALKQKRSEYVEQVASHVGVDSQTYVNIADSFPRQQEELARLSRDKAINERIYAMLLERFEAAKITERLDSSENRTKFRIIEPARLPLMPMKHNRATFSLLGLLLGGACGFGFVYLLDYTDSSFKNDTQLKDSFDSPVLGNISKIITQEDLDKRKEFSRSMLPIVGVVTLIAIVVVIVITRSAFKF
ncbi:MAG: hypothetical protein JW734_05710 [Candidatus Omnitrophica bacterium]|nr:hypothetical protein [Candidatus Omnitrophota bacterium]